MGFDIHNDGTQQTCFILGVLGATIAIVATALRFVATKRAGRKANWEDWFALLSTVFFLAYIIPFLYFLSVMNGRSAKEIPPADIVKLLKAGYFEAAQFCMQQLFAKFSLLFLYYRLFHVNRNFVICVYFLGIVQLLWSIITYILHYVECSPVKKFWHPEVPGHCMSSQDFLAGGETPNCLIDFAIAGLAVWMIQALQMRFETKLKLSILFALGGLAGVLGFVKVGQGFTTIGTHNLDVQILDPLWAVIQQTCSIVCCCAPVYKPLIPELGILEKLRSFKDKSHDKTSRAAIRAEQNGSSDQNSLKQSDNWIQLDEHNTRETSGHQTRSETAMEAIEVV